LGLFSLQAADSRGPQNITITPNGAGATERLQDPDIEVRELERLINFDPVIGFKIMTLFSSPLYAMAGKIDSLSRAINLPDVPLSYGGDCGLALHTVISHERAQCDDIDCH
jgi:hypothetical protein